MEAATEAMERGDYMSGQLDPLANDEARGPKGHKLVQGNPQAKNETRKQEGDKLQLLTAAGVVDNRVHKLGQLDLHAKGKAKG